MGNVSALFGARRGQGTRETHKATSIASRCVSRFGEEKVQSQEERGLRSYGRSAEKGDRNVALSIAPLESGRGRFATAAIKAYKEGFEEGLVVVTKGLTITIEVFVTTARDKRRTAKPDYGHGSRSRVRPRMY